MLRNTYTATSEEKEKISSKSDGRISSETFGYTNHANLLHETKHTKAEKLQLSYIVSFYSLTSPLACAVLYQRVC